MITVSTGTIFLILLAVFLGAVLTLAGAALGALVVYRTKREPHESLFKVKKEIGDAFVLDDFGGGDEDEAQGAGRKAQGKEEEKPYDPFPPILRAQHEKLAVQMAKEKMAQ